jgi:hypothetical protein
MEGGGPMRDPTVANTAITVALGRIRAEPGSFRLTDLTKTSLGNVQNRYFRLFTPVDIERGRLPTALPDFSMHRHTATLSDSPVTTAAVLGGHWTDHNLAAITQLGSCNYRCSYCYVDFHHLSGHDSFPVTAAALVREFVALRGTLARHGRSLTILRVSGGEPLLAPDLVAEVHQLLQQQGLDRECMLKVESNLSALPVTFSSLDRAGRDAFRRAARGLVVHATLHKKPHEPGWERIRSGAALAVDLGIDLFPAIGGDGWSEGDMHALLHELESVAVGLAARLAVRPFNLSYTEKYRRRAVSQPEADERPSIVWETLLRRATGRVYLDRPRHEVRLQ